MSGVFILILNIVSHALVLIGDTLFQHLSPPSTDQ